MENRTKGYLPAISSRPIENGPNLQTMRRLITELCFRPVPSVQFVNTRRENFTFRFLLATKNDLHFNLEALARQVKERDDVSQERISVFTNGGGCRRDWRGFWKGHIWASSRRILGKKTPRRGSERGWLQQSLMCPDALTLHKPEIAVAENSWIFNMQGESSDYHLRGPPPSLSHQAIYAEIEEIGWENLLYLEEDLSAVSFRVRHTLVRHALE
ncbi:uncharacterized protein LOC144702557 [Wolffia australiana]